jgi:hypothetical protein
MLFSTRQVTFLSRVLLVYEKCSFFRMDPAIGTFSIPRPRHHHRPHGRSHVLVLPGLPGALPQL